MEIKRDRKMGRLLQYWNLFDVFEHLIVKELRDCGSFILKRIRILLEGENKPINNNLLCKLKN